MRSGEQQSKIEIIKRRALEAGAVIAVGGTALTMAGCSNVEAQSPEVTTTTTAEQTPDEIITITPSPSPEVSPTDIPEYIVNDDTTEVTQSPESGTGEVVYIDAELYLEKTPEELTFLETTERDALWNAIAQGSNTRQSFDEFTNEYYSFTTDNTIPGKPTVAPPPPSINSTPDEIKEHNAARIRYIAAFSSEASQDFDREQIAALSLFHGVNSDSYRLWVGFYESMPDGFTGKTAALNKGLPLAYGTTSASEIKNDGKVPYIEITGPNADNSNVTTATYMYVEQSYTTTTEKVVTKGNWMIQ